MPNPPNLPPPITQKSGPAPAKPEAAPEQGSPRECGGPAGPEPTRYGDWEVKGRCSDF